jgi:hypothetical protein
MRGRGPERRTGRHDQGFFRLPVDRFPNTLALHARLFACDLEERFEFGLEVFVKSLAEASES